MAIESKIKYPNDEVNRIQYFYDLLLTNLDLTAKQLKERFDFQATAKAKQFPLLMSGMWNGSKELNPDDEVREVIKTGTLGIGFIGLAETLIVLVGKHHGESEESQKLGLDIIKFMNKHCDRYKKEYNLNYGILATPAEGLSGKFTKADRLKYGVIENVTDKNFYTNSNHVPVWYKCSVSHKAKIEAPYHDLTRSGHIFYVELDGDATHNPKSIEKVVDLMDKNNMGYGSINHTRTRCLNCGFENANPDLDICPDCGSDRIDVIQRITGYLVGTLNSWNDGKKSEYKMRVTHGNK